MFDKFRRPESIPESQQFGFGLPLDEVSLLLAAAMLRERLELTFPDTNDDGYQAFRTTQQRLDIFDACKSAAEYADEQDISAVVFIDRSARAMARGFQDYWQGTHAEDEPSPSLFFIGPDWFKENSGSRKRKIAAKIEEDHPHLAQHKDKPILVVDTCVHEGLTSKSLLASLEKAGFKDVRFGVVSESRNYSSVTPDLVMLDRPTARGCYPFSRANIVSHNETRLFPDLIQDDFYSRDKAANARREIRQIIKDGLQGNLVTQTNGWEEPSNTFSRRFGNVYPSLSAMGIVEIDEFSDPYSDR